MCHRLPERVRGLKKSGLAVPSFRNLPAPIGFNLSNPFQIPGECWLCREGDMFFVVAVAKDYVGHEIFRIEKVVITLHSSGLVTR